MQTLDLDSSGFIDVANSGPVIYKVMVKIGLARLWEALSSSNESTQRVDRDAFTKVFLSWLGITEQFELAAISQGTPSASMYIGTLAYLLCAPNQQTVAGSKFCCFVSVRFCSQLAV